MSLDPFELQNEKIIKKLVKFHFVSLEPCPMCDVEGASICSHCGRKYAIGDVEFEAWVYDTVKPIVIKTLGMDVWPIQNAR